MTLLFYNLALLAALVVSAPWWLFRMATTHKYREGLRERLGLIPAELIRQRGESSTPLAARSLRWRSAGRQPSGQLA